MSRPRTFDTGQALDEAMLVFWRLGYDRASLGDLTKAMGISRPSLYAAFGNKESLFRKALDHYARGHAGYDRDALALPTAREVAEALLRGAADIQTRPDMPHGCLAILGAPTCGEASSPIAATLIEARRAGETELRDRFERARAEATSRTASVPTSLRVSSERSPTEWQSRPPPAPPGQNSIAWSTTQCAPGRIRGEQSHPRGVNQIRKGSAGSLRWRASVGATQPSSSSPPVSWSRALGSGRLGSPVSRGFCLHALEALVVVGELLHVRESDLPCQERVIMSHIRLRVA